MRTIYPLAMLLSLALTACVVADEPKEPEDVWALDLNVKSLRTITVDVPQQGKKTFHYLRYEIVNNARYAETIIPMFELVTEDKQTGHMDAMRTEVFKAIVKQEDPDGKLDLKDSVTIAKQALATSKSVQGIAIWEDVDPKATRLSVFVSGLLDGWTVDDKKTVRRKTLQLNFKRDGDTVKFVEPPKWLYRLHKFAEKNDKDSEPPPKRVKTDQERQALRKQIGDLEAEHAIALQELKLVATQVRHLCDVVNQMDGAFKNRPAGDTPELQRKQLDQIQKRLVEVQEAQQKKDACSFRLERIAFRRLQVRDLLER